MTKTILLTITLLACTAWMAAQSTSPQSSGNAGSTSGSQTTGQSGSQAGEGTTGQTGSETARCPALPVPPAT